MNIVTQFISQHNVTIQAHSISHNTTYHNSDSPMKHYTAGHPRPILLESFNRRHYIVLGMTYFFYDMAQSLLLMWSLIWDMSIRVPNIFGPRLILFLNILPLYIATFSNLFKKIMTLTEKT